MGNHHSRYHYGRHSESWDADHSPPSGIHPPRNAYYLPNGRGWIRPPAGHEWEKCTGNIQGVNAGWNCYLVGPEKRCMFCRETQFISYREFGSGWPPGYQSFATNSSGGKSNTWNMAIDGTGYQ